MLQYDLTDKELEEAIYSLKTKKSPGWNEITVDVIKPCFDIL